MAGHKNSLAKPMKFLPSSLLPRFSAIALLLVVLELPATAQVPKSLLPPFGNDGAEFKIKAKDGHSTHGWLPKEWTDNSEWAPVNATYTKLPDSPDKDAAAVRIKVENVEDGQLQLTTFGGNDKYLKGGHYVVSGWVRSPDQTPVKIGIRQINGPYELYHEQTLNSGTEWKPFEFAFTPTEDRQAFVMFIIRKEGTVDLAGITLTEKP
jgi:hypothetical protein